jgi:hypothetical protein
MIILLTPPIGRQEYDNLDFLTRHKLMPTIEDQAKLELGQIDDDIYLKASHWRALNLPTDPMKAAEFIKNMKKSGVFNTMLSYLAEQKPELTSDGVKMIWEEVNSHLQPGNNVQ